MPNIHIKAPVSKLITFQIPKKLARRGWKVCWRHFDDMEMTLCIISLCLNVEWSFKCKYGIKSAWGFLTSAQQWYLAAFPPPYNNLMLFAWAGFVSAVRTFVFDANKSHLNTSEREKGWECDTEKCIFECVCVVIFGQNIKTRAEQQDSLFCLHHISHKHAYAASVCARNPLSAPLTQSHECSKSCIHLLCCDAQNFCIPFVNRS